MNAVVVTDISVEADIQRYTLTGDDIYIKRYTTATVPQWYKDLISSIITTDTTITDIQGAIDFLTLQDTGFNQSILNLTNTDSSINASLTTLTSQVGTNTAGIGTLNLTKVDSTQATAISENVVASAFGTGGISNAWFTDKISTYSSAINANASNIQTLSATVGGQTVRIDSVEQVAIDAAGWSASASKLITDPSGNITGWSFADGTGVNSTFKVYADNFIIQGASTPVDYNNANLVPSINTAYSAAIARTLPSEVANAINTNTTTISGSKITTGTVNAAQLNATAISGQTIDINSTSNAQVTIGSWSAVGGFTTNRDKVAIYARNTSGISGNASFACDGAEHGGYFVGNIKGAYADTLSASGEWGFITYDKTYSGAGYLPFTGAHITYSLEAPTIGDIIEVIDSWVVNINQAYMQVQTTSIANTKKVLGVCSDVSSGIEKNLKDNKMLIDENGEYLTQFKPYIDELLNNGYNQVSVNSLGEGAINVCGLGGNIEIGDYICSSAMSGKGMKQDDGILHNYTVAKAMEAVTFTTPEEVRMIACTYHCG